MLGIQVALKTSVSVVPFLSIFPTEPLGAKTPWRTPLMIALANMDRFLKFFYQLILGKIIYVHTKTSTSPVVSCYTLPCESRK